GRRHRQGTSRKVQPPEAEPLRLACPAGAAEKLLRVHHRTAAQAPGGEKEAQQPLPQAGGRGLPHTWAQNRRNASRPASVSLYTPALPRIFPNTTPMLSRMARR